MKVQVVLPLTLVASVTLMGIVKIRKKEHDKEIQRIRFAGVKLRVTNDVLREYQSEKDYAQSELDKAQKETSDLDEAVKMSQDKGDKTKGEMDICSAGKKTITDELAILETEFKNLQAVNEKEEASWKSEVDTLKSQLEARSPVCNFLKEGSNAASKLCGAPKKEEAETAKKEEPKAEAAKPEEPKTEAAKKEEPKAEAAKPEEPKAEAAKPEEPKAEAAKPEEPKAEAAKKEEPKAEAAKK